MDTFTPMENKPYQTAVQTDVLNTFRRFGFVPPSETLHYIEKWKHYRSLSLLSEEAFND